jgi:hypothetical protein
LFWGLPPCWFVVMPVKMLEHLANGRDCASWSGFDGRDVAEGIEVSMEARLPQGRH